MSFTHKNLTILSVIALSAMGMTITPIAQATQVITSNPIVKDQRIAAWEITGIYLNINGQSFYFGEYSQTGNSGIVFPGSTWEIKSNGQVIGHGYGRVSGRAYRWACQKLGGC
jgi:hypothetical protein